MSIRDLIDKTTTVTPHDSNKITITSGILVGVAGDVKVMYADGSTDTVPLAAGIAHPLRVVQVFATGTTATGIHAVYSKY